MKKIKDGVVFTTEEMYNNIENLETTDLVNELVILEKQYKRIAGELFKRVPSVDEEKTLRKER